MLGVPPVFSFFFFNDTATTEIYTLSLHDALPIWLSGSTYTEAVSWGKFVPREEGGQFAEVFDDATVDRKSTRLNSSHGYISYAVFCLKKKKKIQTTLNILSLDSVD